MILFVAAVGYFVWSLRNRPGQESLAPAGDVPATEAASDEPEKAAAGDAAGAAEATDAAEAAEAESGDVLAGQDVQTERDERADEHTR
jgi:hypothetical protein